MSDTGRLVPRDLASLRLFAMGRIPRCAGCPRYRALLALQSFAPAPSGRLPAVPAYCHYQVCAPMAARYETAAALAVGEVVELRRDATRS